MTLQELTSHLQSLCHEGHALCEILYSDGYRRYMLDHMKFYVDKTDDGTPFVVFENETAE